MKKLIVITLTSLLLFVAYKTLPLSFSFSEAQAQDEITDEFEINEPAVEINPSKENVKPENSEMFDVPEKSPFSSFPETTNENSSSGSIDLSDTPAENVPSINSSEEKDMVTIRTREEGAPTPKYDSNTLVELRAARDVFLPYKQRQNDWGFLVSFGAEQTLFPNLITTVGLSNGDDFTYNELFGSNGINMLSVELGPKYNTSIGSFALLGGYGFLNKKDSRIGTKSEITVTRYSASVAYYLDTLFSEPYFVPYVGGGMWQADYKETSASYPDEVGDYSTKPGTQWRVGALFGLDWIEQDSSRRARRQNGTQGAFLNVYAITTTMSESNPAADLSQEMDIGASVIVEF